MTVGVDRLQQAVGAIIEAIGMVPEGVDHGGEVAVAVVDILGRVALAVHHHTALAMPVAYRCGGNAFRRADGDAAVGIVVHIARDIAEGVGLAEAAAEGVV